MPKIQFSLFKKLSQVSVHPRNAHLLQVYVIEVVWGPHGLGKPALGRVHAEGEDGLLWHVAEAGVGAGGEGAVHREADCWLQHVPVVAAEINTVDLDVLDRLVWR